MKLSCKLVTNFYRHAHYLCYWNASLFSECFL